jgi:ankyrin repeat protein
MLLRHGFDVTLEDCDGNNSLNFISKLLERRLYNEALQLARILLQQRACDANRVNAAGRSLLSQSVTHGDACADLTRLLLNYGAQVLPFRASPSSDADDVARERDASAFTWFLRTAMRHQDLSASRVTLRLLCDALAVDAEFMRRHVLSTMLHLGQQSNGANSASLASLFVQIKSAMTPFWRQPLSLRHACVARIRASLGPKNMIEGGRQLNLPPSLLRHLHLE